MHLIRDQNGQGPPTHGEAEFGVPAFPERLIFSRMILGLSLDTLPPPPRDLISSALGTDIKSQSSNIRLSQVFIPLGLTVGSLHRIVL